MEELREFSKKIPPRSYAVSNKVKGMAWKVLLVSPFIIFNLFYLAHLASGYLMGLLVVLSSVSSVSAIVLCAYAFEVCNQLETEYGDGYYSQDKMHELIYSKPEEYWTFQTILSLRI